MKTTIDNAGRIVLPKSVLESASLCAGAEIEITMRGDDVIELRPAPRAVRVERHGHLHVAVAVKPGPTLTEEMVTATREALRHDRALAAGTSLAIVDPRERHP